MAEINIVARNTGGGGGTTPPAPQSTPASTPTTGGNVNGGGFVPDAGRLTEEFRKLMQQQGAAFVPGSSNSRQLLQQFAENQKKEVTGRVASQFDEKRVALDEKYEEKYLNAKDRYNDEKRRIADKYKGKGQSFIENTDEWKDNEKYWSDFTNQLDRDKKKEDRLINNEEKDTLTAALRELTAVMKDVKEGAERDDERGDTQNSYLGGLRAQREALIKERDSATTEDEAKDASRRIAEVDEKMRRATGGGEEGKPVFDRYMMGAQGVQQMFGGLESGDMGGAVMGAGSTIAGFGGLSLKAAMRVAGVAALVAGAIRTVQGSNERYNSTADLAAYRSTSGGRSGKDALTGVVTAMYDAGINKTAANPNGTQYEEFGLDYQDFSKRAANVVQNRGTGDAWYSETLKQIGLERQFGLRQGTLEQGSALDRYGKNVTDAISGLVNLLSERGVQGVNNNDFSRVQEKYDFQQALMQGYLERTDRPDYHVANRAVLAVNEVTGITHDQRDITDYQAMQNAIQNPMNDRMKSLLYSTVQEMMPEMVGTNGEHYTALDAGRMDLIDRAIRNPENETKIIQAMIKKISEMYGGIDTQMGYFAFKNIFPNITADRLDQYVNQFASIGTVTDASWTMRKEEEATNRGKEITGEDNAEALAAMSKEYTHGMTRSVGDIKKILNALVDVLTTNKNVADAQSVRASEGQ